MKKILSLLMIAILSLGIAAFVAPKARAATPIIYPTPSTIIENYGAFPVGGQLVNISIMCNGMDNLGTVEISAKTNDSSVAQLVAYYKGVDFTSLGFSIFTAGSFTSGDLQYLDAASSSPVNIDNPANVFILTVNITGFGVAKLDIYEQYVGDLGSNTLLSGDCPNDVDPITVTHVVVVVNPVAAFTYTPPTPHTGDIVSFDASASTGGSDDGTFANSIIMYYWQYGDGATDTFSVAGGNLTALASHTYASDGTYAVNLTITTNSGPMPAPSYSNTATVTHMVTVYPVVTGRDIDLFTDGWRYGDDGTNYSTIYTGYGVKFTQVDSYSPQDLVCFYINLTYNGVPIVNKEVALEVHGPLNPFNNITLYRQAMTNGSGIAEICFRIPWPDVNSEAIVFGNWTVVAKADVANQELIDSHWFYVHWIVQIEGENVTPNPVYRGNALSVNIMVNNWAMEARDFTFAATLYDELGVPVGSAYMTATAPGGPLGPTESGPYTVSITVPAWAYVGVGTVYKDLFTKLPWLCGICWSPESSENVVIKA